MRVDIYIRLAGMMLLQYAVWGAWLPVAARLLGAPVSDGGLGFDGRQVGWILGLGGSIGAICAPFIAGQFADRVFSTERVLAVLLAVGGAIQWTLASQTSFSAWLGLSIAYSIVYMPTLALTNSLALSHLSDAKREFPWVRVWGTIGWIAASWAFPVFFLQTDLKLSAQPPFLIWSEREDVIRLLNNALRFSGGMSIVYAFLCLFLPHTPPKRDAVEKLAFARAARLFRRPSFTLLVIVSLAIAAIHNIYFIQTPNFLPSVGLKTSHIGPAMTVGQFAELLILPTLGLMLTTLGFRAVITLGCLAYAARFAVFGTTSLPLSVIVASQALHGLCYACFFAASYIYVDRIAPADVRHSAQTLIGILILGGGPVVGGYLSGLLSERFSSVTAEEVLVVDYRAMWYTLSWIGLMCAAVITVFFRDESSSDASEAEQ
ncbi:MAG: MFS transporter [Phycisphaerae bacterium]|nr:MAG: hypothetical protein EDS66_05675 [Planctomycetota bacterium]KAB2946382.1 MAG: nucleoside permease [Phycisphaerae bacterium]MBE7457277.1 MFS transporter [Planctomycetia bacterium]MCL4719114.1 MFS transporter [Phycisphaerae bacterium]MCQ3921327.1 hypothetical protein [Planctomycetota bacterium]